MLEQLCDYFANGNRLYEEPQMTKEELTLQKENPEQKEQPEYIDEFHFSKPYQTEYEYVMQRSGRWNGWYEYYYETEGLIKLLRTYTFLYLVMKRKVAYGHNLLHSWSMV